MTATASSLPFKRHREKRAKNHSRPAFSRRKLKRDTLAIDNSLDLIASERFRERHSAGYNRTVATGQSRYAHDALRVPAVHKDGRPLSIAFTVGLLYGRQGKMSLASSL